MVSILLKKAISILLAALILLSSTGICFAIHYCPMSKRTTFSLHEMKSCCSSKAKKDDCCKKRNVKFEKIKDNYTLSQVTKAPNSDLLLFALAFTKSFLLLPTQNNDCDLRFSNHEPPDRSVSLVILNRTFLI